MQKVYVVDLMSRTASLLHAQERELHRSSVCDEAEPCETCLGTGLSEQGKDCPDCRGTGLISAW